MSNNDSQPSIAHLVSASIKPERCGSCRGVINTQTGECRCS